MGQLNLYGIVVEYDEGKDYGILFPEADGKKSYAGFAPFDLGPTAEAKSREGFVARVRQMMADSREPSDTEWGTIVSHVTEGGKPKAEKNEALANTRALLAEVLAALPKKE